MLERNSSDWAGWASEARQRLIGFGDDGTGDPYCVSRDGSNCVYVWHPIGQEVYGVADTIQDFWIGWIHGTIKN